MSSSIVGALFGVGVQMYANVARKMPAMSSPWKHVVSGFVGAGAASWLVEYEDRTTKVVQGKLADRMAAERSRRAAEAVVEAQ